MSIVVLYCWCHSDSASVLSHDPPPCNCSDSKFLYAPCGHIVTGDLNIVRYIKLRDLLSKDQNTGNLSHIHDTKTLTLSWMHVKSMQDGGQRKKTSKLTLFLSGSSRSPTL